MLDRIAALLGLGLVALGGHIILRRERHGLQELRDNSVEYHNRLVAYVDGRGTDPETYHWLLHRSVKMQREMGGHGIMAQFRPPFAQGYFTNWPIVLNALPEVRQWIHDDLMAKQALDYAQIILDALVRYGGALDDRIEEIDTALRNPLVSFREGVQAVLRTPFLLLHWVGLTSAPALSAGPLLRIASGLVALVSLFSGVVTIAVGWEPFLQFLRGIWPL